MSEAAVMVKVSAAYARQLFQGCDPEYIATTCKARCCESSVSPTGTSIAIHRSEQAAIEARGGKVSAGLLVTPGKRCTFKTEVNLCGLHGTSDKPLGCVASPFTLNGHGTLIVRNRYRRMVCFGHGKPAYVAFGSSLERLFGSVEAAKIVSRLSAGGGDIFAPMARWIFDALQGNTETRKASQVQA